MPRISRRTALSTALAWSAAHAADESDDLVSPPGPGTVLPITLQGGIILHVSVNGLPPAPFAVDTGATRTVLDSAFAEANGLHRSGGGKVVGIGGRLAPAEEIAGLRLSVNRMVLPPQDVRLIAFPNHVTDRGKRPRLAGLIGLNAFDNQIVRINLKARQLTLLPPGTEPDSAGIIVPLNMRVPAYEVGPGAPLFQRAAVAAIVDGMDCELALDTGAGGGVLLHEEFVDAHRMLENYRKRVDLRSPGSVDGSLAISLVAGTALQLGGLHIDHPILALAREAAPAPVDTDYRSFRGINRRAFTHPRAPASGVIGLTPLARYVMFLDAANERLVLEPSGLPAAPPSFRTNGLSLDKPVHNHFSVLSVIAGTPAAAAGFAVGDEIVAANGIPATDLALFDLAALNAMGPVAFRLASGTERRLGTVQLLP